MENHQSLALSVSQINGLSTNTAPTFWIKSDKDKELYLSRFEPFINSLEPVDYDVAVARLLSCWRLCLGITEAATREEMDINSTHIRRLYGEMTIKELYLAIEKSLAGVLTGYDDNGKKVPLNVKPYGKFSPLYISSVLNAYIKYRDHELNRILREKDREENAKKNIPKELSIMEKAKSRREYLQYFMDVINQDGVLVFYDKNDIMWNFLVSNKLVDPANLDRLELKQKAETQAQLGKTVQEIMTQADSTVQYVKHLVMQEFFAANKINLADYNDENILY